MDESDDQSSVLSPAAFITGLDHANVEPRPREQPHGKPRSENYARVSLNDGTNESEKSERKRLAGLKSREKKRKQLNVLEESVNDLTLQIEQCQAEISRCKNELVEAIKLSTHVANGLARAPASTPTPSRNWRNSLPTKMQTSTTSTSSSTSYRYFDIESEQNRGHWQGAAVKARLQLQADHQLALPSPA